MKKIIVLIFGAMVLLSCKKEESIPKSNSNSNSYSTVIHRFEISKKQDLDIYCSNPGGTYGDFYFGVDVDGYTHLDLPFVNFIDSVKNSNISQEIFISFESIQSGMILNNIKLKESDNSHSISYFNSLSEKKTFDLVVNTENSYNPFFRYVYKPENTNYEETNGYSLGSFVYLDELGEVYDDTEYFISNDTLYIVENYEI